MRKSMERKIMLTVLAGTMLFANNIVLAAENSNDMQEKSQIVAGDNYSGLTVGAYVDSPNYPNEKVNAENKTIVVSGGEAFDVYAAVTGGGDAIGNTATMTGGKVAYIGGAATDYDTHGNEKYNESAAAINNKVIMSGGEAKEVAGGEAGKAGKMNGNYVEFSGNAKAQNVYGANGGGIAEGNYVKMTGGTVTGTVYGDEYDPKNEFKGMGVYGAYVIGGEAINNYVEISGGEADSVFGAYSSKNATGNYVKISKDAKVDAGKYGVVGAQTENGDAVNNYVEMTGGSVNYVTGAIVDDGKELSQGNATGNRVIFSGGKAIDVIGADINKGKATENIVTINGGEANYVYGAYSGTKDGIGGTVENNKVVINDGKIGFAVGGAAYQGGSSIGNTVEVNGGIIDNVIRAYDVYGVAGGVSDNGKVQDNKVIIQKDANVTSDVFGGRSETGNVNNNSVIIDVSINGNVYGGYTSDEAINNYVEISGGSAANVYGAKVVENEGKAGSASGNYVKISGNTQVLDDENENKGDVAGAKIENGDANNNYVEMTGGNVSYVTGAIIESNKGEAKGNANGNGVILSSGKAKDVIGATVENGNATNNYVKISGNAEVDGQYGVAGAATRNGDVVNNYVEMTDGNVNYVVGAFVESHNGISKGNAVGNSVIFSGGKAVDVTGAEVVTGNAENNTVTVNGGETYSVHGAYSRADGEKGGDVKGNTVIINGGKIGYIMGGAAYSGGNAINNTVEVKGGEIGTLDYPFEAIIGGESDSGNVQNNEVVIHEGVTVNGDVYGGISTNGNVIGNKVVIMGAVKGAVYAGAIDVAGYAMSAAENNNGAVIKNNIVQIIGNADISGANIYGANQKGEGNVLEIGKAGDDNGAWSGSVNSIGGFDEVKMVNVKWDGETAIMTVNDVDSSDLRETTLNADGVNFTADSNLKKGDTIKFIAGANDSDVTVKETKVGKFTVSTMYSGIIETNKEGNQIVAGLEVADQNDLLAENRAVAATFVNQGSDLINDSLDTLSRSDEYGVKTFAAVYGNRSKYDVNSDLKINGWSTIVGAGNSKKLADGDLSWGVFYENGSGNYRTYNSFNDEFFRGDGSLVYNGGGAALRYEQNNGVYTEASFRAGMLKSEMTNALKDVNGSYGYKNETTYYGAHIGIGKVISLSENSDLDIYGKFFHTYNEGDDFTLSNGSKYSFDSITSDRLRIGTRLTANKANKLSSYYGLAWEYEFNGDADMTVGNMAAPQQSLQGSSYMAEIGMNYQPSADSPWSFDVSMRGYAGEREGFSGNVQAVYSF